MIKAIPFEFVGGCTGCGEHGENRKVARAGVSVVLMSDLSYDEEGADVSDGEWLCLSCATELAEQITAAVAECKASVKEGLVYQNEEWGHSMTVTDRLQMSDGRLVDQGGPEDRATWWKCGQCQFTGPNVGSGSQKGTHRCMGVLCGGVEENPNVPRVPGYHAAKCAKVVQ